jgi:hypothetical protein
MAKFSVEGQPFAEGNAEMRGSGGHIQLKKIIRSKTQIETFPEQRQENFGPVVDAPEQYGLHQNGDLNIDAGGQNTPGLYGKLAGVVDMHGHPEGFP